MADLPLSKTLDPADFGALAEELEDVDAHFTGAAPQHPMRRWEYAMALHAFNAWLELDDDHRTIEDRAQGTRIYDVGGAGSPFFRMVGSDRTFVIDPAEAGGQTLAAYLRGKATLAQAVFCLSVLEHVEDLDQFLYHLSCLVAPGGLLFLTMDCRETGDADAGWPPDFPPDDRHFHWMRRRIFTPRIVESLLPFHLADLGFDMFGRYEQDKYHGHQLYGSYSFASLALRRRP